MHNKYKLTFTQADNAVFSYEVEGNQDGTFKGIIQSEQDKAKVIELKDSRAGIFYRFCDSAVNNKKCTYEILQKELGASAETIVNLKNDLNASFVNFINCECFIRNARGRIFLPDVLVEDYLILPETSERYKLYEQELIIESDKPDRLKRVSIRNAAKHLDFKGCVPYLICGEGGCGKTHLLKLMYKNLIASKNVTFEVYFISLAALLIEAVADPIPAELHCGKQIGKAGAVDNNKYTSYIFRHIGKSKHRPEKDAPFILLLDGLNELFDSNQSHSYNCLRQLMNELEMLGSVNVSVIITTRDKNDSKYLNFLHGLRFASISGIKDRECTAQLESLKNAEVKRLLHLPLYYRYFTKARESIDMKRLSEYSKFDLWTLFHANACKQESDKNYEADERLFIFYVILPMIASKMEANRVTSLSRNEVIRLISRLKGSPSFFEFSQSIINSAEEENLRLIGNRNDIQRSEIRLERLSQIVYENLRNISNFISCDEKEISFLHQDIREYFAAFHIKWYLKCIRSAPLTLETIPNFNLRTAPLDMAAYDALGFEKIDDKKDSKAIKEEKRAHNADHLADIFGRSTALRPKADDDDVRQEIYQNTYLVYTAYSFTDNCRLHYHQRLFEITSPFCCRLMDCSKFIKDNPHIISVKERHALLSVYMTLIQHYRLEHDFAKCREVYEFCRDVLSVSCDPSYMIGIRHQYAKAMLLNSQDLFTDPKSIKSQIHNDMSAKEMFDESIRLLRSCMPYFFSGSLLGQIYSMPVKWIIDNELIKCDIIEAYNIYKKVYDDFRDPNCLILRGGTDAIHIARQLAGLLVKGYIRIENGQPIRGMKTALFDEGEEKERSRETFEFAKKILESVEGQKYPFVDYLRGAVEYYFNGKTENMKQYFDNESDNYMTIITQLKLGEFDSDTREHLTDKLRGTIKNFEDNKFTAVNCDSTDKYYLLCDAEMLDYEELLSDEAQ